MAMGPRFSAFFGRAGDAAISVRADHVTEIPRLPGEKGWGGQVGYSPDLPYDASAKRSACGTSPIAGKVRTRGAAAFRAELRPLVRNVGPKMVLRLLHRTELGRCAGTHLPRLKRPRHRCVSRHLTEFSRGNFGVGSIGAYREHFLLGGGGVRPAPESGLGFAKADQTHPCKRAMASGVRAPQRRYPWFQRAAGAIRRGQQARTMATATVGAPARTGRPPPDRVLRAMPPNSVRCRRPHWRHPEQLLDGGDPRQRPCSQNRRRYHHRRYRHDRRRATPTAPWVSERPSRSTPPRRRGATTGNGKQVCDESTAGSAGQLFSFNCCYFARPCDWTPSSWRPVSFSASTVPTSLATLFARAAPMRSSPTPPRMNDPAVALNRPQHCPHIRYNIFAPLRCYLRQRLWPGRHDRPIVEIV